jgi:DNA-binding SARP family transcriptional activator
VQLPSGAIIGTGLAVLIGGTAITAARLYLRRARTPSPVPGTAPGPPPLTPALRAARHAYLAGERRPDGDPALEEAPRHEGTRDDGIPPRAGDPSATVSAGSVDGQDVVIDLTAVPGLGVTGPGADAVIRALAVTVLAQRSRDQAQVIVCGPGPAQLLAGPPEQVPGLTVAATPDDGLAIAEAEITRRRRLLQASGTHALNDFRATHPDEELPFVTIIAAPGGAHAGRLEAVLKLGAPLGIAGIIQGEWARGVTCDVAADGQVLSVTGTLAESLDGARMFQLHAPDAVAMLATMAAAAGAVDSHPDGEGTAARPLAAPPAESLAAQGQPPVELSVLGAFQLTAGGVVIARGLRRKAAELLVYLVLHPDGATTHELLDALWPDTTPERASPILHAATSNIRNLLRSATATPESAFIVRVGDRMRIDVREVGSDLWRFQGALAAAASAPDDDHRRAAFEEAASLWRGDFADGMDSVWIEEHRETLRRDAVDVLARLAELYEDSDPEHALAFLERAITIDRYQEALYQRIMTVQAMLGRRDAARRTYQLLESRLADIDAEPEEQTARLLHQILHGNGSRHGAVVSEDQ